MKNKPINPPLTSSGPIRYYTATRMLAALLANPQYEPPKQEGETMEQAYARRAVDYAVALASELERRATAEKGRAT